MTKLGHLINTLPDSASLDIYLVGHLFNTWTFIWGGVRPHIKLEQILAFSADLTKGPSRPRRNREIFFCGAGLGPARPSEQLYVSRGVGPTPARDRGYLGCVFGSSVRP